MHYFKNMRIIRHAWAVLLGSCCLAVYPLVGAETPTPKFQQAYDLIKQNLPGISEQELDEAALLGLVKQLEPKVSLIGTNLPPSTLANPQEFKASVIESNVARIQLSKIDANTAPKLTTWLSQVPATNKLAGLILDLRYASGDDYQAASRVADLFIDSEKTLLKWGQEIAKSTAKTNALKLPITILANRQTAAAAEAVAAILRQNHIGLILGGRTAGQSADFKTLPLANGRQLRIATNLPRLEDDKELPINGLEPDIEVTVNPEEERVWFADSYAVISKSTGGITGSRFHASNGTNRLSGRRVNEAELVRQQREGKNIYDPELAPMADDLPKQTIQDPTLARAIDLLKGLAVVNRVARKD